jgi:two-component system sensor histidine kinase BaeS
VSFRLRVLALLALIALTATGATAWLTLRQAAGQVKESVAAGRQDVRRITEDLRAYGFAHGTWDGVSPTVRALAKDTGQRIRVVTDDGTLLADSDALAGRTPRPPGGQPPVVVDPRPRLRIPAGPVRLAAVKRTVTAVAEYRSALAHAGCLTRAGATVTARPGALGVPEVTADGPTAHCVAADPGADRRAGEDHQALAPCADEKTDARFTACLRRVFAERTAALAPPRLQVGLGFRGEAPAGLAAAPTVAVAAGVALVAVLGALLLSRAVLRPVRALTSAARGLGEGELARRVPVSGRDEIAELGRAFNRMAASLQSAEERQRRLTGDIAHELRTPLANLRGYLEALRDGVVDPSPELLDSLHEEAMLQQRIVDDLQDLALAEAGALTYHRADVGLGDLLEAARTAHAAQAEAAGVTLSTRVEHPVRVHADADRLRQVVGNLVGNALRATPPGGTVTLAAGRHDGAAVLRVTDTGTGIPADQLPHLFDRFWRADAARGRTTGGSGLGLSITRQIVADHGGTVEVESTVGVGTTFTVTLAALP